MPVRATQLTRRVRLATIPTDRLRQTRAQHTTNAARLHSALIILAPRAAAIPGLSNARTLHRNSVHTLRRRVLIPHPQRRVARTRHRHTPRRLLAVDRQEEAVTLQVAVVEIEAVQDHTAAKPQTHIQVRIRKKARSSSGFFLFFELD
jgi:hypothetical protein